MADHEHEVTYQFKNKTFGKPEQVEVSRKWIERQIQVSLHDSSIKLEIVSDEVKQNEALPGIES